jgi:two-component system NtrC family sensor kinase
MAANQDHIIVVVSDQQVINALDRLLRTADYTVTIVQEGASALRQAAGLGATLVILGDRLRDGAGLDFAGEFTRRLPALPVILYLSQDSPDLLKRAIQQGIAGIITQPLEPDAALRAVRAALDRNKRHKDSLLLEARRFTSSLQRQVDEMETLTRLGRQVTASLDIDAVLAAVVDAAVQVTGAEEGSLLLLDEDSGELYMRAARNFQEDFVRTFRLPVNDSLAGKVIRTGEAVLFDETTPKKIKTSYLVQSLLYTPLARNGSAFGVLGVDNRHSRLPFTAHHISLLTALAGYAVIALENARLYSAVKDERNKLETILTGIQDGVVVIDQDQRLGMVNRAARDTFGISNDTSLSGKLFEEIFTHEELVDMVNAPDLALSNRTEICPDDNQVLAAQLTPIAGVGRVLTLHDITYLKKLDRIKTDFVHTVSHDLRSPLTAILGYVELIERAGQINDLQRDFIRRIQASVRNITSLIDNLLDLGRIESGFDVRREKVHLGQIIRYSAEGIRKRFVEKGQNLQINVPADLPAVLANPVQMRQMTDHLLDNAARYCGIGGKISVTGRLEQSQVILQFIDNGIGIPAVELPYIFDRFYRASNASQDISGTGLGLAIVKSIVENHGGRIWVESVAGKGTAFTIVLPCTPLE